MKKKLFAVLAATLAGATLSLSACTSGDSKIVFKNYWNYDTEYTSNQLIDETLVYDVSYTSYNSNINYTLDYDGTYTTRLVSQSNDTYLFTSDLDVTASFTVNGVTEEKQDSVTTQVVFYKAGGTDNLRPVSSYKKIVSHSPNYTNGASSPKDCYTPYHYEFTTTYTDGQGSCVSTRRVFTNDGQDYVDVPETYSFSATSSKRSVLDNEQFPVAFRAMPAGTSAKVQMFNPFLGHSQNYAVSLSSDTKEKTYSYTLNGTDIERTIKYCTASIAVDGTTSGLPQQAEIAALQDSKDNTNRNIMLYYGAPLANYMGILEYKLISANYQ
ncbi:MAG: hypothetical protein IJY21_03105 [Clostridia bacterium]|nr:hypothetical protein [Clostridia bacterium]